MKTKNKVAAAAPGKRMLLVTAAAEVGNDLTRVEGVAYSGGTFSQYWSIHPCVTDLAGLEIAPQIPLMYNHFNEVEQRIVLGKFGHVGLDFGYRCVLNVALII